MVKGSKMTEEAKKKISEGHKGEKNSQYGRTGDKSPNFGKHHSEETKRKIKNAQLGEKGNNYGKHTPEEIRKKISESMKGEKGYWFGKHLSDETKEKISENHADIFGEKNSNYKHGLTGTKAYQNERNEERRVRKRNQSPELTEIEEKKLLLYYKISEYLGKGWHVDHIQPISKGGLHHPDNLQVLRSELNLKKRDKYPLTPEEEIEYRGIRI